MEQHYITHPDNPNSTERGWIKQTIELVLTIHGEEWYFRCDSLTSSEKIDDEKMPAEKYSFLLTIKLFYENIGSLPV